MGVRAGEKEGGRERETEKLQQCNIHRHGTCKKTNLKIEFCYDVRERDEMREKAGDRKGRERKREWERERKRERKERAPPAVFQGLNSFLVSL